MAWLSDEEWELQQDCREKKSVAASAHKQRTHCGKGGCKLPSDFMTKKEIKAMNGECVKYASLKGPMNWTEFKRLPGDLKKEYVLSIRERFNAPNNAIADMFNVSPTCISKYFKCLGLVMSSHEAAKSRWKEWDEQGFNVWRGRIVELPEIPVSDTKDDSVVSEVVENTPETPVEPAGEEIDIPAEPVVVENAGVPEVVSETRVERKRAVPGTGKMTFDGPIEEIVETLRMLLAGAEVTLDVAWTVIDKE